MTNNPVRDIISFMTVTERNESAAMSAIDLLGVKKTTLIVGAAFGVAVLDAFPGKVNLRVIRDFVKEARSHIDPAERAPQLISEGLIRMVLGESELLDEIPGELILPTQVWLTTALAKRIYPEEIGVAAFIDESLEMANQVLAAVESKSLKDSAGK